MRDLTEEGIEPHPGPGIVSQNVDGLTACFDEFVKNVKRIHFTKPILAAMAQEHHLTRDRADAKNVEREAERAGLLLLLNHMPSNA